MPKKTNKLRAFSTGDIIQVEYKGDIGHYLILEPLEDAPWNQKYLTIWLETGAQVDAYLGSGTENGVTCTRIA